MKELILRFLILFNDKEKSRLVGLHQKLIDFEHRLRGISLGLSVLSDAVDQFPYTLPATLLPELEQWIVDYEKLYEVYNDYLDNVTDLEQRVLLEKLASCEALSLSVYEGVDVFLLKTSALLQDKEMQLLVDHFKRQWEALILYVGQDEYLTMNERVQYSWQLFLKSLTYERPPPPPIIGEHKGFSTMKSVIAANRALREQLCISFHFKQKSLLWLLDVFDVESLHEALENEGEVLNYYLDRQAEKSQMLVEMWGGDLKEALRWVRLTCVYERWYSMLLEAATQTQAPGTLRSSIATYRTLTYDKYNYLSFFLTQSQLVDPVCVLYDQSPSDLKRLKKRYVKLLHQVEALETRLKSNVPFWQACISRLTLALTQQGMYQFGQIAYLWNLEKGVGRLMSHINIKEEIKSWASHLQGVISLGLSLWGATYMGYSYHLIAGVNRVALAEVTLLLKVSNSIDHFYLTCLSVLPKTGRSFYCAHTLFRWDTIGFFEKQFLVKALIGLAMEFIFSTYFYRGENPLPVLVGYLSALCLGGCSSKLAGFCAEYFNCSQETVEFIKQLGHILGYSLGREQGFSLTKQYIAYAAQQQEESRALKIFGLQEGASEEALHARYRFLAKKFHPDTCPTCDPAEIVVLNEAANTLFKPQI